MVLVNREDVIKMILEDGIYCDTDADKEYSVEKIKELPFYDISDEDLKSLTQ